MAAPERCRVVTMTRDRGRRLRLAVPDKAGSATPAWLVSLSDLIVLMLTFFVLIFAMGEPEPRSWRAMVDSVGESVGQTVAGARHGIEAVESRSPVSLSYLAVLLESQFADHDILSTVRIEAHDDRVVIVLPDYQLFVPEGDTLTETGRETLFLLSGVLRRINNRIDVTAQADREAVLAGRSTPLWGLALRRAVAVAGVLTRFGYGRPLIARSRLGPGGGRGGVPAHRIAVVIRDEPGASR